MIMRLSVDRAFGNARLFSTVLTDDSFSISAFSSGVDATPASSSAFFRMVASTTLPEQALRHRAMIDKPSGPCRSCARFPYERCRFNRSHLLLEARPCPFPYKLEALP